MKALTLTLLLFAFLPFDFPQHTIAVYKFEDLEERLSEAYKEEVLMVNFWATWCRPCVKELPYLDAYHRNENVKVLLVNLDFAKDAAQKVSTFVDKQSIESEVIILDEMDYNSWIPKVDSGWSGAIPATLFINTRNGKQKFLSKSFEKEELDQILDKMFSKN